MLIQLVAHFEAERSHLAVVQIIGQSQVLVLRCTGDFIVLLVDVAGVLDADFDLLDHRVGQPTTELGMQGFT